MIILLVIVAAASGYCLACLVEYLDSIRGDVFCYSWPRCWKRATHYIVTEDVDMMDEGMCERHAHIRSVELIIATDEDPSVLTLPEAVQRARLNRALHMGDDD